MEHRWGERLKVRTRVAVRVRGGVQVSHTFGMSALAVHYSLAAYLQRLWLPFGCSCP